MSNPLEDNRGTPIIQVDANNYPNVPIENQLCKLLSDAVNSDSNDEYEDIMDQVLDSIFSVGEPRFSSIPPRPFSFSSRTIHDCPYPDSFHFRIQTIHGQATCVPIGGNETNSVPAGIPKPEDDENHGIDSKLVQCSSKNIDLVKILLRRKGLRCHVKVNGRGMFCKADPEGLFSSTIATELDALHTIHRISIQRPGTLVRIPKLTGYIRHAEVGGVIGFLREWIPVSNSKCTMRDVNMLETSRATREKWAAQIHDTLKVLLEVKMVWGNLTPSNVVIDTYDDAWLIDFTGGWAEGWVDSSLADAAGGDLQGLEQIIEFLQL